MEPRQVMPLQASDEDSAWVYAVVAFVLGLSAWIGLVGYVGYLLGKRARA